MKTEAKHWHSSKFQRVSRLGFVTEVTSLIGGQPKVSWAGTLYIHFRQLLPPTEFLQGAKFTLRPSLASAYILVLLFFLPYSERSQTECLPYFHT